MNTKTLAAKVKREKRKAAIKQIALRMGVSEEEAENMYSVCISAHQRHMVSRGGAALEKVVEDWIREDILRLIPDATFSSQDGRGLGGNPIDGLVVSPKLVLGVNVKTSGRSGGLGSILDGEHNRLSTLYPSRKVRLVLVKGEAFSFPADRSYLLQVFLTREDSVEAFKRELKFLTS